MAKKRQKPKSKPKPKSKLRPKPRPAKPLMHAPLAVEGMIRGRKEAEIIERGLKTRIVALLMLILASSLGLWFAEFQAVAILLWLLIIFIGGYAVLEFDLFVSKAFVFVSALVMQFLVLDGVPNLLVMGSPGDLMLIAFGIIDIILIYALAKL